VRKWFLQGGMAAVLVVRKGGQEAPATALGVPHLRVTTAAQYQMARVTHQGSKLKQMVHITVQEETARVQPATITQQPMAGAPAPSHDGKCCTPP
jgi:hypothetical protein